MNQVSFDMSSERHGSAGAADAVDGAVQMRSLSVESAPGCAERCSVRIFGRTGFGRLFPLHETVAAPPRHEPYPVAA